MTYLPESGWARIAVTVMYIAVGYAAIRWALPLVMPFIAAWVIALIMQIPTKMLSRAAKIPNKAASAVILCAVIATAGFGIYFAAQRTARELEGIGESITGWADSAASAIDKFTDKLASILPIPESVTDSEIGSKSTELIKSITDRVTEELAAGLSAKLPDAVSALPDGIFFVIITGIASFYINADFENINRRIISKLPRPIAVWLENTRARIKDAWKSWLKACIWLMAVTFAELFCGFLILGIDYSFTIALLCAAADLLPIIGTGTILIPWSAVLLIEGSYYKGIGLLIIWGVTALVRQILEPRIVGTSIGLDPLITLAAIYAGWKLAGIWGSICAPLLAVLLFGGHTAAAQ